VQIGAQLLGNALVGGVTNEHVPETKRVLDRLVWPDQLLSDQCRQDRPRRPPVVRRQLTEHLPFELEADDGRVLEHDSLSCGERVETCSQERLDGRGNPVSLAPLGQQGEQLLDEERVALCHHPDPGPCLVGKRRAVEEVFDQLVGLALRERLET